jgi:hypothetical protein
MRPRYAIHAKPQMQMPLAAIRADHAGASLPSLPVLLLCGGGGGSSKRVFSAIILWKPMPTPSMTAKRMAQPIAPFLIALGPPRTARAPPVKKPAMIAFHGSSFFRTPLTAQSKLLNMPPHTPKLPPRTGARALIAVIARRKKMTLADATHDGASFDIHPSMRSL